MDFNLIRSYARIRAHMFVTRLFLVGLVCIHWHVLLGLLILFVLVYVERSLTHAFYDYLVEKFEVSFEVMEAEEVPHDEEESG